LIGEEAARYKVLEAWRSELSEKLGVPPAKLASDKALFGAAVDGSSAKTLGFDRDLGTPPF
jgi:hypothetical protein